MCPFAHADGHDAPWPPPCQGRCRLLWIFGSFDGRRQDEADIACSKERRAAVIAKMLPPTSVAILMLSRQEGISEVTLYMWRSEAQAQGRLAADAGDAPTGRTARDKFAAVVKTASLRGTLRDR